MNFQYKQERSWFTRMWTLMILLLLSGGFGKMQASSDFATSDVNRIIHQPTVTEPYIAIRLLIYDASSSEHSFFVHDKVDNITKGPLIYFDDKYLFSLNEEMAWPGGGSGSYSYLADACYDYDEWWSNTYRATVDGVTYTLKFWNPVNPSSKKCYVDAYIFLDKFFTGTNHTLKIKGIWRKDKKTVSGVEIQYQINSPSLGVGEPTSAVMTGDGKMKISGNLSATLPGTFQIGSVETVDKTKFTDDLKSSFSTSAKQASYSDQTLNCYRTNYYDIYKTSLEFIYHTKASVTKYEHNVSLYQWYDISVPGYARAKDFSCSEGQMWDKTVIPTWNVDGQGKNQDGTWSIYRYPEGKANERVLLKSGIKDLTGQNVVEIPDWDKSFTYEVSFIPTGGSRHEELTQKCNFTLKRKWNFQKFSAQAESDASSNIKLEWVHEKLMNASGSNSYVLKIQRSTDYDSKKPNSATWEDLDQITITSKETSKGTYVDKSNKSNKITYYYRLVVNVMEVDVYSSVVSARLGLSKVVELKATRGSYNNMVKLQWQVNQVGSDPTNFSLQRRPLGSTMESDWVEIYTTSGVAESYSYDDMAALPGSYNEYKVCIWEIVDGKKDYANGANADGFSLSSGIISGNITYGTGVAVPDAKVTLKRQNPDGDLSRGMSSLYLDNSESGFAYLTDNQEILKLFKEDFTMQMWLYPESKTMNGNNVVYQVFDSYYILSLGLKKIANQNFYNISVAINGTTSVSNLKIPGDKWSHLSLVFSKEKKSIIVLLTSPDEQQSGVLSNTKWTISNANATSMVIGNNSAFNSSNNYRGCIDEFRFFTKALTADEIKKNYNHPLAGNESGLAIYYPFDEGLSIQSNAYDFSKTNGVSNGRHAKAGMIAAKSSDNIPGEDKFNLMAYTDETGYFEIRGVPFSGEGTSYTIIPEKGIHDFSPVRQSRFVSQQSLIHSGINFEDVSSFPVSGKVIYSGTDYPVEDVNFYVDGTVCTMNGEMVKTNENGEFTISVPIGEHYITVKKEGHVFANGRYPESPSGTNIEKANFTEARSGFEFRDTTLVNFTGRVVGGDIQGDKPLGGRLSVNNIGVSQLILTPVRSKSLNIIKQPSNGGTSYSYKPNPKTVPVLSDTLTINSKSWRGANNSDCNKIFIQTDSITGEFSALVPPLEYQVSVSTVLGSSSPKLAVGQESVIDLTNPRKEFSDTLFQANGDYNLYNYHTKLLRTYHAAPTFTVVQQGHEDGSFGIKDYVYADLFDTIPLTVYDVNANDGTITYNYGDDGKGNGVPLFKQEDCYIFEINGFEKYVNADNRNVDIVPLDGTEVKIANALSAEQSVYVRDTLGHFAGEPVELKNNTLKLDSIGYARYKWKAGYPNVAAPYTRTITMTYNVNGTDYLWSGSGMKCVIIGDLPTGNNFVTSGPDRLHTILRDPPGTGSFTEWSSGSVTTTTTLTGSTWSENFEAGATFHLGGQLLAFQGVSAPGITAGTMEVWDSKDDLTAYALLQSEGESSTTEENTLSIVHTVSTSDDPGFVGDQGDVFIGSATNIIFGNARHVGFLKENGKIDLGLKDVLITGMEFSTTFNYTLYYIENTLFPNYEKLLRNLLVTTVEDSIKTFKNKGKHPVYLTTLSPDDEGYGTPGTYVAFCPSDASFLSESQENNTDEAKRKKIEKGLKDGSLFADSVKWINNQLENWKLYLELNEKQKVQAVDSTKRHDNYSFDGGAIVSHSVENVTVETNTYEWTCAAGLLLEDEFGVNFNHFGMEAHFHNEVVGGRHSSEEESDETSSSYSFTLAEEGDDALSVDVYTWGNYGPIFRTRGGQTSNPYEGEVTTNYYKKGTTIMEGTMQIEVPQIGVDINYVGDIPVGSAANYVVTLSNASEIGADVAYKLFMLDETNPKGAQISIDGKVLTEGRLIKVPGNQSLIKALQLRQTDPSVLDYDSIGIVFASESQPEDIADTIFISAHFTPSSSPVTLALSNSTMNTETGTELTLSFTDFDRNYHNLKAFRLQRKSPGATNWTQIQEYVVNASDTTGNNKLLPKSGAVISNTINMASYPDGEYKFRVVSASTYGISEVYRYSDELTLVKDMSKPRPMGQPEPADGVYEIGDELSITFNEPILKGELSKERNFTVTGVLNGSQIAHETALSLQNVETAAATTEASIMLGGKNFSFDMWLNLTGGAGTILSHGNGPAKLSVGTNADGKLLVTIDGNTYTSENSIPFNSWVFLTLSYEVTATGGKLNADVAHDSETIRLFHNESVRAYNGNGPVSVGKGISGAIHELLLWDEAHDMSVALMNRGITKNPSTRHLIGYWKMDEGEGTSIRDYSRNRHMTMADETWYLNNENKAVTLDGSSYMTLDATKMSIFADDDYVIEFWMRGAAQNGEAQLIQMGEVSLWLDGDGSLKLTGKGAYDEDSDQTFSSSSGKLNDNAWHHVALSVLRQGAATVYVDGKRCLATGSANVGGIATNKVIVGARRITLYDRYGIYSYDRPFKGQIDEIRIWNATINSDLLIKNRKVRLTGSENGLIAYYPFETKGLDQFNQIITMGVDYSLVDKTAKAEFSGLLDEPVSISYTDEAPALRVKPIETNVNFSYVANNEKIVISIDEEPARIEGATLNFSVHDVLDENGNYSDDAIWSAFVSRKQLVWENDELSLEQKVKDESSITATIINKGGQQQMWSLSDVPEWLTPSADYGVVNPRSETSLTFTIKPSTPIGKYVETVYLTDNDGLDVPLTLNVKVTANKPDWTLNPKLFENSMNVIGTFDMMGVMSEDDEDIIAAFIGEECRGIAHPVYKERYGGYYVTIDIYGSPDDDEPLTFRAYDASTGTVYPEVTTDPAVSFEQLTLIGTYAKPVRFSAVNKIEQQTELKEGWNWLSIYVNADDMSVASVFDKIADDVIMVKSQSGSLYYEDGSWNGDMGSMLSNTEMYAVKMKADRTLRVVGERVEPGTNPITVYNGWNWIGYYGRQVSSVTDAMADLSPEDGNIIKAQSGVAYYDTYEWAGSLSLMEPGVGYKLQTVLGDNMTKTFRYPSSVVNMAPMRGPARNQARTNASGIFQPVDFHLYSNNLTMAAKIVKSGKILANAEIGVFADGECRAAGISDENGIVYLTVPGDDAVILDLKISEGANVTDFKDFVEYQSDAIFGSPKNPIVLDIDAPTGVIGIEDIQSEFAYDLQGRMIEDVENSDGIIILNNEKIMLNR